MTARWKARYYLGGYAISFCPNGGYGLVAQKQDNFVLGDAFMQGFYVVFDADNKRVGIANKKETEELESCSAHKSCANCTTSASPNCGWCEDDSGNGQCVPGGELAAQSQSCSLWFKGQCSTGKQPECKHGDGVKYLGDVCNNTCTCTSTGIYTCDNVIDCLPGTVEGTACSMLGALYTETNNIGCECSDTRRGLKWKCAGAVVVPNAAIFMLLLLFAAVSLL